MADTLDSLRTELDSLGGSEPASDNGGAAPAQQDNQQTEAPDWAKALTAWHKNAKVNDMERTMSEEWGRQARGLVDKSAAELAQHKDALESPDSTLSPEGLKAAHDAAEQRHQDAQGFLGAVQQYEAARLVRNANQSTSKPDEPGAYDLIPGQVDPVLSQPTFELPSAQQFSNIPAAAVGPAVGTVAGGLYGVGQYLKGYQPSAPGNKQSEGVAADMRAIGESILGKAAKPMQEYAASWAVDPAVKDTFLIKSVEMGSGALPYLVTAALGTAVAGPAGGTAAAAALAGAQSYGTTYDDAIRKGASEDTARNAAAVSALVNGGLMSIPVGGWMMRLPALMQQSMVRSAAELAVHGMVFSGVVESQKFLDNVIAKSYYDPERDLGEGMSWQDVPAEIFVGAILPGASAGAMKAWHAIKNKVTPPAPPAEQPKPTEPLTPEDQAKASEQALRDELEMEHGRLAQLDTIYTPEAEEKKAAARDRIAEIEGQLPKGEEPTTAAAPENIDTFVNNVLSAARATGGLRDLKYIGEVYDTYVQQTGDNLSLDQFKAKLRDAWQARKMPLAIINEVRPEKFAETVRSRIVDGRQEWHGIDLGREGGAPSPTAGRPSESAEPSPEDEQMLREHFIQRAKEVSPSQPPNWYEGQANRNIENFRRSGRLAQAVAELKAQREAGTALEPWQQEIADRLAEADKDRPIEDEAELNRAIDENLPAWHADMEDFYEKEGLGWDLTDEDVRAVATHMARGLDVEGALERHAAERGIAEIQAAERAATGAERGAEAGAGGEPAAAPAAGRPSERAVTEGARPSPGAEAAKPRGPEPGVREGAAGAGDTGRPAAATGAGPVRIGDAARVADRLKAQLDAFHDVLERGDPRADWWMRIPGHLTPTPEERQLILRRAYEMGWTRVSPDGVMRRNPVVFPGDGVNLSDAVRMDRAIRQRERQEGRALDPAVRKYVDELEKTGGDPAKIEAVLRSALADESLKPEAKRDAQALATAERDYQSQARAVFRGLIAGDTPPSDWARWARRNRISPELLAQMTKEAVDQGLLRQNADGRLIRTALARTLPSASALRAQAEWSAIPPDLVVGKRLEVRDAAAGSSLAERLTAPAPEGKRESKSAKEARLAAGQQAAERVRYRAEQLEGALGTEAFDEAFASLKDATVLRGRPKNRIEGAEQFRRKEIEELAHLLNAKATTKMSLANILEGIQARHDDLKKGLENKAAIARGRTELASFSQAREDGREQRIEFDKLHFRSELLERFKQWQEKGTPEQALAWIRKQPGVKEAEIKATKLYEFLNQGGVASGAPSEKVTPAARQGSPEARGAGEEGRSAGAARKSMQATETSDGSDSVLGTARGGVGSDGGLRGTRAQRYPTVTRDEIVSFLRDNRVSVKENVYGEPDLSTPTPPGYGDWSQARRDEWQAEHGMTAGPAKWSTYSLDPSNPTYRETVLHLPETGEADKIAFQNIMEEMRSKYGNDYLTKMSPTESARYDAIAAKRSGIDANFRQGHFSEPNVIAHARTSIQKDGEGKAVFVVDEAQSDAGQKAREGGVRDEAKIAELKARYEEANRAAEAILADARNTLRDHETETFGEPQVRPGSQGTVEAMPYDAVIAWLRTYAKDARRPELQKLGDDLSTAFAQRNLLRSEIRTAEAAMPAEGAFGQFIKTTDQWVTTLFRRLIRQAIEAGADHIAIVPGKVQNERFDIEKHVDYIAHGRYGDGRYHVYIKGIGRDILDGTYTAEELPNVVGREIADRIIAREGTPREDETTTALKERGRGTEVFERNGSWYIRYESGQEMGTWPSRESAEGDMRRMNADNIDIADEDRTRILKGEGLKVGGHGMRATYDAIYPRTLSKLLSKIDPSIKGWEDKPLQSSMDGRVFRPVVRPDFRGPPKPITDTGPILFHTFPLTEKVKEHIRRQGIALFSLKSRRSSEGEEGSNVFGRETSRQVSPDGRPSSPEAIRLPEEMTAKSLQDVLGRLPSMSSQERAATLSWLDTHEQEQARQGEEIAKRCLTMPAGFSISD